MHVCNSFNASEMEEWERELKAKEVERDQQNSVFMERECLVKKCFEGAALKERKVKEQQKAVEEEEIKLQKRCLEVDEREKELEQRFKEVELKKRKNDEYCKVIQVEDDRVVKRSIELGRRQKVIKGRFEVVESKEKGIVERLEVVESKEKEVEKRFGVLELKEESLVEVESKEMEIEVRFRVLELKEKNIKERSVVVDAKEKKVEERFTMLGSKEKNIEERLQELDLKEKELNKHKQTVVFKEKQVDWCMQELEFKKKQINERQEALELWERKMNEGHPRPACELDESQVRMWCSEMDLKQKQVEGFLKELELKSRQIDERSQALDLKEKLVDEHCMAEELRERETDERCHQIELEKIRIREQLMELAMQENKISEHLTELELKKGMLDGRSRGLDLKEKKIDELNKKIEMKQKEINEKSRGLTFAENRISRVRMELERRKREYDLKEKKLNEDSDSLKAKESQIDNRTRELNIAESKMKEVNATLVELEVKKMVKEYTDGLKAKERQIDNRLQELKLTESRMKEVDATLEKLNEQKKLVKEYNDKLNKVDKLLKKHSKDLKLRQKEIEDKELELKVKEKEFNQHCQARDLRENVVADVPIVESLETEGLLNDLSVHDGESLQLHLNDRVDEHCFMGGALLQTLKVFNDPPGLVLSAVNGFFPPHLGKANVEYTARTVRSSCVLLLEQLMNVRPEVCKEMRIKAGKTACLWRQKMQEYGEKRIVVLGFLLLVVAFRLRHQFERDELKRLWEIVNQHRLAPQLRMELDLFEECEESSNTVQLEIEQRRSSSVVTDDMNIPSDIQSACTNMDANFLRSYLKKYVTDYKLFPQKIVDALKCAPEPAMLVFRVLQTFNLLQSTINDKIGCIFLLEQLMKLQKSQSCRNPFGKVEPALNPPLQITQDMKMNVLAFASRWKHQLQKEGLKPLEVYGFLQFVASYKLASFFVVDEVMELFKVLYDAQPVYWPKENPHLCRELGFTKKIPGLIRSLIKEDRRLQAAKYICTFMVEPHFPLDILLKDHVKFAQQRVEKIRGLNTSTKKIKATYELSHLREVVQYIKDYMLEKEYSPSALESRINQLEAIMANLQTDAIEKPEKSLKLSVIEIMKDGEKNQSPEILKEEFHQGKRLKVEALKSPARHNLTFKVPSAENSFSPEISQAMLPHKLLQPCSHTSAGQASPSEHSANHLETSPTTKCTSTPSTVYSIAVVPYGGGQTQKTKQQPAQHCSYGSEYPDFPQHGVFPGASRTQNTP